VRRALSLAAAPAVLAAALAGCTGSSQERVPGAFATRPATTVLRDTLILTSVKARLTAQYPDSATSVGVSVADGVVTLRGTVRDLATRRHMVADAERTTYVARVADRLRVDPHAPRFRDQVGDVALAARLQGAIAAQLGLQQVGVRVDHGVATLTGTVADAKTKRTMLATARGTSGIRNVVDRIRVGAP
jgi:osmotically-inducible protein OsmY